MISRFSIFLSLVTYVYFGNVITARKVFIVSSFYNILNESMVHFWPMAITVCAEGYISVKRIQEFMLIKEMKTDKKSATEESNNGLKNGDKTASNGVNHSHKNGLAELKQSPGVYLENVTAEWLLEDNEKSVGIKNVNLQISEPELCTIIGAVGSGKSTFLNVVLKELEISEGQLTVNGIVSYAAQEAWLFNGSVKNNILFTEDFDEKR
jgi:ATP-binding cassette, subfamily C (CFTR/MRP), member 4